MRIYGRREMRGGRRAWRALLRLLATAQLQHEEGRPYGRALRHAVCAERMSMLDVLRVGLGARA